MLTRRDVLIGAVAATISDAANAQAPAPAILRLQQLSIEVNGKAASVFGILQLDGTHGIATEIGNPFRARFESGIDAPCLICFRPSATFDGAFWPARWIGLLLAA